MVALVDIYVLSGLDYDVTTFLMTCDDCMINIRLYKRFPHDFVSEFAFIFAM